MKTLDKNFENNCNLLFQKDPELKNYSIKNISPLEKEEVEVDNSQVICIYGLKSFEIYEKCKGSFIVFIEDNIESFFAFCKEMLASKILSDPKVKFFFLETVFSTEMIAKKICWYFSFLSIGIFAAKSSKNKKIFLELEKAIREISFGVKLTISDVNDMGITIAENLMRNLYTSRHIYLGSSVKNLCNKVPAIICGAGPSLEKNISQFGGLNNKALIFAGGAAIDALLNKEITPHFTGGVDKQSAIEVCRCNSHAFFYQNRIFHETFSKVVTKAFIFPENQESLFYDLLQEELFQSRDSFDSGWTVSNFLTNIACLMGCDPIIFVGMDLAYTDDKHYIGKKSDSQNMLDPRFVETLDITGKKIKTQKDWLLSARWTATLTDKYPDIHFINATEGGIGFGAEIKNIPLEKVILKDTYDFQEKIFNKLEKITPICLEKSSKKIKKLEGSFLRCKSFCQEFLENCQKLFAINFTNSKLNIDKELAYIHVLSPIWRVFEPMFIRELDLKGDLNSMSKKINQILFFQNIIEKYLELFKRLEDE